MIRNKLNFCRFGSAQFAGLVMLALSHVAMAQTPTPASGLFVAVTPCRIADTRLPNGTFGGPTMSAGTVRDFPIPKSSCGIPAGAVAYSLNITVVPHEPLQYLTAWPTGQPQPFVSTLNSLEGLIVANAAIVPAGTSGAISIYVTNTTDVVIDIDGYFGAVATGTSDSPAVSSAPLFFVPVTPCRVVDTRNSPGPLGGPSLGADTTRSFPIPASSCSVPSNAGAYILNATVVPKDNTTDNYLTLWPAGQVQPFVSTLNWTKNQILSNMAIVPAGTSGEVDVFVTGNTDLILDISGYFSSVPLPEPNAFTAVIPCRVVDTRNPPGPFGGPTLGPYQTRSFPIPADSCGIPTGASAYSLNVTVVPEGPLQFLTIWPTGEPQPNVSTLNSFDGRIVADAAIVPAATSGAVSVFVTDETDVILDINGYFKLLPIVTAGETVNAVTAAMGGH